MRNFNGSLNEYRAERDEALADRELEAGLSMSKRYGRALAAMVEALTLPMTPFRRAYTRMLVANALLQPHEVATRAGCIRFITSNPEALTFSRDLLIREPETLDWIDRFATPCTFWDVGANIGGYALYAALRPQVAVLAFEPSPASYASLCRNIELNGREAAVQAYCIAFSRRTGLGRLAMSATAAGSVFNSFERTANCADRSTATGFRQAMLGFSIDDFRRLPGASAPNYLKIDVDGIEEQILDGAAITLADPLLRSVLIEMDEGETERNTGIKRRLEHAGFELTALGAWQFGNVNAIFTRGPR